MQRFLDLADFSREQVLALLELARRLEARPEPQALKGKILGLLFLNPSLRTLASFQAGMARLGGSRSSSPPATAPGSSRPAMGP
jgi:ornithine carbamoyltransferase